MAKDISSTKMRLWVQLVLLILLFGISTYFAFSKNLPLPLPEFMFPERDMQTFLGVNLGVMIAAAVVSCTTVGGGLINLFTLKADNDSAVALATVAAIGQGVALVIGFEHMATPWRPLLFPHCHRRAVVQHPGQAVPHQPGAEKLPGGVQRL